MTGALIGVAVIACIWLGVALAGARERIRHLLHNEDDTP